MFKNPEIQPPGYFDFVVPPLEALWFMNDCDSFVPERPDEWS